MRTVSKGDPRSIETQRLAEQARPPRVLVVSGAPLRRQTWCRTCSVLGALPTPLERVQVALELVGDTQARAFTVLLDGTGPDPDPDGTEQAVEVLLGYPETRVAQVVRVVRTVGRPLPARPRLKWLAMPVTEADLYPLLSVRPRDPGRS